KDDVPADGVGARTDRIRRFRGYRVGVDPDASEVVAEARLHLGAGAGVERASFAAENVTDADGPRALLLRAVVTTAAAGAGALQRPRDFARVRGIAHDSGEAIGIGIPTCGTNLQMGVGKSVQRELLY